MVAYGSEDWKWGDQRAGEHSAEVICEYEVWQPGGNGVGKSNRPILVVTCYVKRVRTAG